MSQILVGKVIISVLKLLLKNEIYIQETLLFSEQYNLSKLIDFQFEKENLELINEDGEELLVWKCPVEDVVSYYQRLRLYVSDM